MTDEPTEKDKRFLECKHRRYSYCTLGKEPRQCFETCVYFKRIETGGGE